MVCQNRRQNRFATRFCLGHNQVCAVPFPRNPLPASPISPVSRCELPVKRAAGAFASKAKKSASLPGAPAAARTRLDRNPHRRCGCPVPLTVRGTQALVSFAPLAFKLFCAARQNAVLRRSPFPPP